MRQEQAHLGQRELFFLPDIVLLPEQEEHHLGHRFPKGLADQMVQMVKTENLLVMERLPDGSV